MKHKTQPTHTTQPQLPFGDAGNAGGPPATAASGGNPTPAPPTSNATDEHASPVRSDAEPTLAQLQAENAALKKQLREQTAHASLKDKLKQAGARTPQLLLGAAKDALRYTVAGELENAVEIIEALQAKFPEQFGMTNTAPATTPAVPSIDAGAGRTSSPTLTKDALAKMTPAEIAELNWDDVRRVLAAK
ncbi:MAG: hypothetical protein JO314_12820 [Acidobacteria bacterium]|nr:hypothetical protein [Acidobacteriota bacterium]